MGSNVQMTHPAANHGAVAQGADCLLFQWAALAHLLQPFATLYRTSDDLRSVHSA